LRHLYPAVANHNVIKRAAGCYQCATLRPRINVGQSFL
jgi:hypothetical protein